MSVKVIKENINLIKAFIYNNFNNSFFSSYFPSNLKNGDITSLFKKRIVKTLKTIPPYKHLFDSIKSLWKVDVWSNVCIYSLYIKKYLYIKKILSKWQCGFRQGCSTQHCLLTMTEKCSQCLDKGGERGALLTDLSKAFDCLLHDPLIAKLAAYGFDNDSLVFIQSYLSEKQQRTKVNTLAALILTYYMVFHKVLY